jgi:hypothetical protein
MYRVQKPREGGKHGSQEEGREEARSQEEGLEEEVRAPYFAFDIERQNAGVLWPRRFHVLTSRL